MKMNTLIDVNVQETNLVKLQKGVRQTVLKTFECSECGLTFDRASQLGYHYRSIHLGERSQICQICGKGFFRKADLRTHLNIHLGTNVCICEICGRKFNHISNLIRHCRMHAGVKPYLCSICDRRFTQVSSLVRHKRIIHGIPKETMRQYCSSIDNFTNAKPQDNVSKENKFIKSIATRRQLIAKRRYHCKFSKDYFNHVALLRQCKKYLFENTMSSECNNCKMTINSNIENKSERIYIELECQNSSKKIDVQKDKIISDLHGTDTDNKATMACLPLETIVYVTSKQLEESNLAGIENINQLSQDYLAGIEEKLESVDISTNEAVVFRPQDTVNNHEEIQSKDNIICLHQLDRNSFTFLPRDRGPTAELQMQNVENILRSSDLDIHTIQDFEGTSARNDTRSSNMEANLEKCNSSEVQADQKYLPKQICKEITAENKKCDKSLNDDNQLYIELSDLGLLKFDESRYCNNTDSVNMNLSYAMKSANIAANDLICTPVITQSQGDLVNEENLEGLSNSNNIALNNEEPTLRLVQTENGEQFYEFIIRDLVEKMQNASCAKNLENKTEETSSSFRSGICQRMDLNLQGSENNQTRHQQTLEDLTDINSEFNYAHFDFHREEKNLAVLYYDDPEHFQQDSTDNECTSGIQEKNLQHAYNSGNLELLENESHVDFDKYVETNLEVFERLNYENCTEKLLELVEVADISVESSGYKEPMVCLIQNDGEQLLELLQDSQIAEQESNQNFVTANDFDNDCSNVLQDNIKIADYPESKSEFLRYIENSMSLGENTKNDQSITQDKEECMNGSNHLYTNPVDNESASNETNVKTIEQLKKPKTSLKKFQCSVCKKAFSTAYNYKQHIGIHFTDQQKFHCKECGVSFAWKSTLNKHVANNHSSDGPQKFICNMCPRVYSSLSQVNDHVKRDHLKERKHICPDCGKSFFKSFDLKTHNRTHTNERPYVCRVCGKRFHHQSHIIRHERTHSGERPYSCDVCQKTFTQPGSLKAHRQKHQQVKVDILGYQVDEDDPSTLAM